MSPAKKAEYRKTLYTGAVILQALGGASANPLAMFFSGVLNFYAFTTGGKPSDWEEEAELWIRNLAAKLVGDPAAHAIAAGTMHGIPAAVSSLDISSRVSLADLLVRDAPASLSKKDVAIWTLGQMFGAPGDTLVAKPIKAWQAAQKGDISGAIAALSPKFIADIARVVHGGPTDKEGKPELQGDLTTSEKIIKGLGLNTTREGEYWRAKDYEKTETGVRTGRAGKVRDAFFTAEQIRNPTERAVAEKNALLLLRQYNNSVPKNARLNAGDVERWRSAGQRHSVKKPSISAPGKTADRNKDIARERRLLSPGMVPAAKAAR